ncbi:MAG: hypothetical protein SGARI_006728, partial [Bacillariaceae sp.]
MSSDNSTPLDLPTVPALNTQEPGTPTLQYTSADQPNTPTASNQPVAGSKKDKSHKSSSLFSSSRKAGSKIVKTGVLRPARAVGRLVRGTSKGEPPGMVQRQISGERGEVEAAMSHDGSVSLQIKTPNGYGTMNQSGHRVPLSANTTMPMSEGMTEIARSSTRSVTTLPDAANAASKANWPVHTMEALTRQLFLVCVAYILGAHYPEYLQQVSRATEFAATAWITCIAILCLSFLQRRFPHVVLSERDKHNLMMAAGAVMDEDEVLGRGVASHETVPLLRASPPK